jgi:hypothetical protein
MNSTMNTNRGRRWRHEGSSLHMRGARARSRTRWRKCLVDLIYYLLDIISLFFRVYSIYRFVYIPFTQTLVFPAYETRSGTCSEKACLDIVWIEVY